MAGFALNDTFKSKMQKSAEACQREGVIFMPMVTESFGGLHEVAVREVVIANRAKDAFLG